MFKRLLPILVIAAILFGTSSMPLASSSPEDDIAKSKVKFVQLSDQIMQTNTQISDLNNQMDNLENQIKKNNSDMAEVEKQINSVQADMDQLKKEIDAKQQLADKRLRAMYINSSSKSDLSMILTSTDLSDMLSRFEAAERIAAYDKKLLNELQSKKNELGENIADLNSKNEKLQQLKNSTLDSLKEIKDKKSALEVLVKQFDEQKKQAAKIIQENEEKLIAHALSVIDGQTSDIDQMRSAIDTLKGLVPQLNTASVKKKAQSYISIGNQKLAILIANNAKPAVNAGQVYKASYVMTATAYTGNGITALGLKTIRDPDGLSTIAVDPNVLPLGTKVYIPSYGYAICADTGGSIKGNTIDLFLNTRSECLQWGVKAVSLYVVAYPGEW